MDKAKIIDVSKARKHLNKLVSQIGQGREAVIVAQYRKPKVALVNYDWLQLMMRKLAAYEKEKPGKFRLAGSLELIDERVDIDAAIREVRQKAKKAVEHSIEEFSKELQAR